MNQIIKNRGICKFLALFLILNFLLVSFGHRTTVAQETSLSDMSELLSRQVKDMEQYPISLEEPIDPDEYMVGPGDLFAVNLWSEIGGRYSVSINPEGTVIIPTVGVVDLNGLTLSQTKIKIKDAVLDSYRNTKVSVTLVKAKTFKVSLTGAVVHPGVYDVISMYRVSNVIDQANGLLGYEKSLTDSQKVMDAASNARMDKLKRRMPEPPEKDEPEIIASRRSIKIFRKDGAVLDVDLLKYERTGDVGENPYVRSGDVIFVPAKDEDLSTCGIFGAVKIPGFVEYVEGDRVSDMIELAHGLKINAATTFGYLVRFTGADTSIQLEINIAGIIQNPDGAYDLLLQPDDRIFIRTIEPYHEKKQITVRGEVLFPGAYWIESDSVMLSEVLDRAGGTTADADLNQAYIKREVDENIYYDPDFERLTNMPVNEMSSMEYAYFKMRMREKIGRVALNLRKLLYENNTDYDIVLRDGDKVVIPKTANTVTVSGQVNNPGMVKYVPGAEAKYYINLAGGYTERARTSKVRIIRSLTGEWVEPDDDVLPEPGDYVWVPEERDIDYWRVIRDVVLFTGNLATVYLVVRQAAK
ncbi:MAG: hypothetical protein GF315_08225 [candidate division Zixibacteria bacterium]|nr:hypothetical protein [candidate division Zixibacteria bacterium]